MPDLNYKNPAVTQEIYKAADFWLKDVGVDGFRVDGAKHLIEKDQLQENTQETKEWLKNFLAHVKATQADAFVIGEVWSPIFQSSSYITNGSLDLVFNFNLADDILMGTSFGYADRIEKSLTASRDGFPDGQYGSFLSNHDQTRVMTRLNDLGQVKVAAAILLTSPGTPFIYYGEEIGMTGDKPDPKIRTPMQWSSEPNAGFSTGTPWEPINDHYTDINVAVEDKDPSSLLNLYRQLLQIRNNHSALRTGSYIQATASSKQVLSMLRVSEDEAVLVLINVDDAPVTDFTIKWEASALKGEYKPMVLYGEGQVSPFILDGMGAIMDYSPVKELPGNGILVIKFLK